MIHTFDLSCGNSWGRAVHLVKQLPDGSLVITGCLTPLPQVGDAIIALNGAHCDFVEVEPMGNPRDGFMATVTCATIEVPA
jgi:hypothetical protein